MIETHFHYTTHRPHLLFRFFPDRDVVLEVQERTPAACRPYRNSMVRSGGLQVGRPGERPYQGGNIPSNR